MIFSAVVGQPGSEAVFAVQMLLCSRVQDDVACTRAQETGTALGSKHLARISLAWAYGQQQLGVWSAARAQATRVWVGFGDRVLFSLVWVTLWILRGVDGLCASPASCAAARQSA